MEDKTSWFLFWFTLITGVIGFIANVLTLVGFASGQLEIPDISILSNPFIISALSLALLVYATTACAFATLEYSKKRVVKKYTQESRHSVLLRGAVSTCNLVWVPGYLIWTVTTIVLVFNTMPSFDVTERSSEVPLVLVVMILLMIMPFIMMIAGRLLGATVLDLHYMLGS